MPEKRKKTIDAAADRQTMMQSMRLLLEWSRICQDARM